jgi:hypothetical protein
MHVGRTGFNKEGRTPLADLLIESRQCDEQEQYYNDPDDYLYLITGNRVNYMGK